MTNPDAPKNQITFWADHRPTIEDGDYEITVSHHIETQKTPSQEITKENVFASTRKFSVLGPRFSLDPQEVRAVFPPEGSLGEHSNVLPHIIFNRATLPWERSANGQNDGPSWLALLVFHEGEEPKPLTPDSEVKGSTLQTVRLGDLGFPQNSVDMDKRKWGPTVKGKIAGEFYTGLTYESGQHADDQVQLITVNADLLNSIIPNSNELPWLAHARQGTDASGITSEPFAVLFANRLPLPKGYTTVHLVSLENLYTGDDFYFKNATGNVSLISLKSWRFICASHDHDFKGLLQKLNAKSLRLPTNENGESRKSDLYFGQGLTPIVHLMRQGNRSVSWYRGPLLPGENTSAEIPSPIPNADSLVRYYKNIGMFDVTYSAAWELGRMLILENKRVSVDLFNWKRSHIQQQKEAKNLLEHLPLAGQADELNLPDSVKTWFAELSLLHRIPFNYLVPDEKLLPVESIRFFQVDQLWVDCLLDGAFAVGQMSNYDQQLKEKEDAPTRIPKHRIISGFMLRSAIIADYPDLLIDGYDTDENVIPLQCLRMERLSGNLLLCLFAGKIAKVAIHQRPESLHFGFDTGDDEHPNCDYYKAVRTLDGIETLQWSAIQWKDKDKRRIDITKLREDIQEKIYLFSIEKIVDNIVSELNQANVSQELRSQFISHNKPLSKSLKVVVSDEKTWAITDNDVTYRLCLEKQALNVYGRVSLNVAQFAMQMIEAVEKVEFSVLTDKS